jgi:hypothetical protein
LGTALFKTELSKTEIRKITAGDCKEWAGKYGSGAEQLQQHPCLAPACVCGGS